MGIASTSPHTSSLAQGAAWNDMTMCALVLEHSPVAQDSRLVFDSFPFTDGLEESYALAAYREHGGNRMPQPIAATYQGGSWGPIAITLKFRAGIDAIGDPNKMNPQELDSILRDMERRVNWCLALGFPLERARVERQQVLQPGLPARRRLGMKRNDPPWVLLVIGTWKVIRGYISNVTVSWEGPWHPVSARPYGATVRMQLNPLLKHYPTWKSIREGGLNGGTLRGANRRIYADAVSIFEAADRASLQREVDLRRTQENAGRVAAGGQALSSLRGLVR